MHNYFLYNFLMFFYMYSVMVLITVPVGPRPVYDSDVVYFYNYLFSFVVITIMPTNLTKRYIFYLGGS